MSSKDKNKKKQSPEIAIEKGRVKKLVKKLEPQLGVENAMNLKYISQNFLMQKEMKLYRKRREGKEDEKSEED